MRQKKPINVEIGKRIRDARAARGMTQEQLAEALEMSPQYISTVERGESGVSLPTLKSICVTLGVSADRLLFGEPSSAFRPVISRFEHMDKAKAGRAAEILQEILAFAEDYGRDE